MSSKQSARPQRRHKSYSLLVNYRRLSNCSRLLWDSDGSRIAIEKQAWAIGTFPESESAIRDALGQHPAIQPIIKCLHVRLPPKHDNPKILSEVGYFNACLLKGIS